MPVELTVRFYAQLNDFLPPRLRHTRLRHTVAARASVKDTIEALGVPHPEVALIVVNGTSRDFTYQLQDGDDVAVYPRFRQLEVAGAGGAADVGNPPAGGADSRARRFVLDVHLGKLAAFLRLGGLDASLGEEDAEVAARAAREGRIVLTRDVALLKRGVVSRGYWVRSTDPESQLAEVLDHFELGSDLQPFTRCLRCNIALEGVDAAAVEGRVPPRVHASFSEFRRCPGCDRIYWPGSHYRRLAELLERARSGSRSVRG